MSQTNKKNEDIPDLDLTTASKLLTNVFAECDVVPNSIPLATLESWGNYKKTDFRLGRIISYTILVLLVLLPLMFFKPTIIAQRTDVDSSNSAIYNIEIKTLLPTDGVYATLDGMPLTLERVNSKNYVAKVSQNGILQVKATSKNGQYSVKTYDVSHLDMEKPKLLKSYTEDGIVYLIVRDTYSGIDYDAIVGTDPDGNIVNPYSIDKDLGSIAYEIPSQPITLSIPDRTGNILEILLSPTS